MSSFSRIHRSIKKLNPSFLVKEEKGCLVLSGESNSWDEIVEAGKLAVSKDHFGVVNNIHLKGFSDKEVLEEKKDNLLDGLKCDVLVIGGGIVGCSILRELSKYNLNSILLEKEMDVAMGQSGRNGGVIHVGIDMKKHPIKASYCVRGNKMYDKLTHELEVPFEHHGQLVLIKSSVEKIIYPIMKGWAKSLDIPQVRYLNRSKLLQVEPEAPSWAKGGIFMPSGGIVNPFKMVIALAENAISNGAKIYLNSTVLSMKVENDTIVSVDTNRGTIYPKVVINAAGVFSDKIAEMAEDRTFTIHPRKGTDIILDKKVGYLVKTSFSKSPLTILKDPEDKKHESGLHSFIKYKNKHVSKGLGVIHSIDGNTLIGPTAIETPLREDYTTDASSFNYILHEEKKTVQKLDPKDIIAYFSGTRAASYEEDFIVRPGITTKNIMEAAGIQSPGLTAAPAIAEDIVKWTIDYLKDKIKVQDNKFFNPHHNSIPTIKDLPLSLRDKLIKSNPNYGEIICRCEEVSKGEIIDALHSPLKVDTLDGIKRRIRPGMGRCQGSFCGPQVLKIIADYYQENPQDVMKNTRNSTILLSPLRGEKNE